MSKTTNTSMSAPMNTSIAKTLEAKDLSLNDIRAMLGPIRDVVPVMIYDDLSKFESIEQVLSGKRAVILLMNIERPGAPRVGHFIAVLNCPESYEHFDSYGLTIDEELAITHESDVLKRLLEKANKKVTVNTTRFQLFRKDVNTCGRHCVVRIRLASKSLAEYKVFIESFKCPADDIVTLATMFLPQDRPPQDPQGQKVSPRSLEERHLNRLRALQPPKRRGVITEL